MLERRSANAPRSYCHGNDYWWYRNRVRSLAAESSNVLSLVSPKETEVGSGFAVCRSCHAAMDAHILSDHGSILLFICPRASMDRNYQQVLKLPTYDPLPSEEVTNMQMRRNPLTSGLLPCSFLS